MRLPGLWRHSSRIWSSTPPLTLPWDKAESQPELAFAVNAAAPAAFAKGLAATGGRLVQVSTDFVFDGKNGSAYRVDDQRNPQSVYGRSKAAGEDVSWSNTIVVRTSWVYAAGGANFVRTMLRLMREARRTAGGGRPDRLSYLGDRVGAHAVEPCAGRAAGLVPPPRRRGCQLVRFRRGDCGRGAGAGVCWRKGRGSPRLQRQTTRRPRSGRRSRYST